MCAASILSSDAFLNMDHQPDSSRQRPLPLRLRSENDAPAIAGADLVMPASGSKREMRLREASASRPAKAIDITRASSMNPHLRRTTSMDLPSSKQDTSRCFGRAGPSPPSTPPSRVAGYLSSDTSPSPVSPKADIDFDFDLDLTGAQLLGSGLWSNVYKVERQIPPRTFSRAPSMTLLTPPHTPQKASHAQILAVKVASRPDAREVFVEEARVLDHLQTSAAASTFVVPFLGLSPASDMLVFACADTTLQSWAERFDLTRSVPELLTLYPSIAAQLASGLAFLHNMGVVHADIKPSNILITFSPSSQPRARFADFSAAQLTAIDPVTEAEALSNYPSLPNTPLSSAPVSRANSQRKPGNVGVGGGTWTFMAPEQLSSNPAINEPSYASDVYSLGVTLLTLILGGASPYREVEQQNVFLLREAIKMGDPLQFVRRDAGLRTRLREVEAHDDGKSAVRDIATAVRKSRADRISAAAWAAAATARMAQGA